MTAAALALLAALVAGPAPAPPAVPAPPTNATAALAQLPVKGRAPKTGYSRDQFGPAWFDVGHNRCDTRDDILRRDLTQVVPATGCTVTAGRLVNPYTGLVIRFIRGTATSRAVQIDHVVALGDAWQTGAQQLTPDQRLYLANDPLNLLAVDGLSNQRKSDADAATWLPPDRHYWCRYVARQVAVKARYRLWVTPAEHTRMAAVLATCPRQQLPREATR